MVFVFFFFNNSSLISLVYSRIRERLISFSTLNHILKRLKFDQRVGEKSGIPGLFRCCPHMCGSPLHSKPGRYVLTSNLDSM